MLPYSKFILEKFENIILESVGTLPFILSNELHDIFNKMTESNKKYSKLSNLYLMLDLSYHSKLNISYLDKGDDNQSIKFTDPAKVDKILINNSWTIGDFFDNYDSKNSIRIGKLTNKVIDLYNSKYGKDLSFTDSEIEDFVNAYKSYYDYNKMDNFKIVGGSLINYWYSEENYQNNKGTLGNSCMRYVECNENLDMYGNSKNIKLLILVSPENRLSGRALLWDLVDGSKFMDRIYTVDDSDVGLFIDWAEKNKYKYKFEQNSRLGAICLPENNYEPSSSIEDGKMECQVYETDFNNREYEKFPYMDTMKYYYWKEGVLRNFKKYGSYFVTLEDTDGWCDCVDCGNDGTMECSECNSQGEVICKKCEEKGCDECSDGWTTCVVCDGETVVKCETCGGFSNTR
jgi:hypothetical protein